MKRLFLLMITAVAVFFTACGGDAATKKLSEELASGYDYDGQEIEMRGYLSVPRGMMVTDGRVTMKLHSVAGQSEDAVLIDDLKIPFGQEPTSVYVPEKYNGSDMEIYDDSGEKHGYLTEVKIRGVVHYRFRDWEDVLKEEFKPAEGMPMAAQVMSRNSYEARRKRAQEEMEKRVKEQDGDPNDYSYYIEVTGIEAL